MQKGKQAKCCINESAITDYGQLALSQLFLRSLIKYTLELSTQVMKRQNHLTINSILLGWPGSLNYLGLPGYLCMRVDQDAAVFRIQG